MNTSHGNSHLVASLPPMIRLVTIDIPLVIAMPHAARQFIQSISQSQAGLFIHRESGEKDKLFKQTSIEGKKEGKKEGAGGVREGGLRKKERKKQ